MYISAVRESYQQRRISALVSVTHLATTLNVLL
jgi:hypothetical protein